MKKYLLIIVFGVCFFSNAQESCGTDERQNDLVSKEKLLFTDSQKFLKSKGISYSATGKYTGQIYTIPVVVHLIVPTGAALGTTFNPTDALIESWIDNANKTYATTYGNGFYTEGTGGTGNEESAVIPFKLVLAKRNPNCKQRQVLYVTTEVVYLVMIQMV